MNWMLLLMPALPLLLGLTLGLGGHVQAKTLTGAGLACGLAVVIALLGTDGLRLDWILLGTELGVDGLSRGLLLLAGVLWGAAAIHSRTLLAGEDGRRYAVFFLLTLAGNLGLLVARDVATFYLGFALMTFAAYGLVVHSGKAEAMRAGRIYLILAVLGEVLLLAGLLMLAAQAGNTRVEAIGEVYRQLPHPAITAGLVAAGFAVKMGVVPLHVWLPLAHPAAPVPASAVLSGIILKAGLLGWIHLLPLGEIAVPALGQALIALGLFGAYYAALVGCFQQRPKTVLAYSSVSQMGLLAVLVGTWLGGEGDDRLLAVAILVFAVHHGLAKGLLFLAVPMIQRGVRPVAWLSLLPVLALAGFPLTSGILAKSALKTVAPDGLSLLLTLTSVTTGLLLLRFLRVAWPESQAREPAGRHELLSWLLVLVLSLMLPWWLATGDLRGYSLQWSSMVDGIWPLALAGLLAFVASRLLPRWPGLPEGDLVAPLERRLIGGGRWMRTRLERWRSPSAISTQDDSGLPAERRPWPEPGITVGALLLLLVVLGLAWLIA
ncbi:MAG: NADH/ubiquinone/plastoquinone (complex I) [Ectothiorhodospiraceae bacterium]|nr:NADH/ubiquinone/plastoquinone (complex I) [Ectothiorhodospiraceae bacterium]MCH8504742.1 complex I subunit 5 family protein [Ectothiorhodospiraceae bacterium]